MHAPVEVNVSSLPVDRQDLEGWVNANDPSGRSSLVIQVEAEVVLIFEDGTRVTLRSGDYVVWQDGEYSGITQETFNDGGWDLFNEGESSRGQSFLEWIELSEEESEAANERSAGEKTSEPAAEDNESSTQASTGIDGNGSTSEAGS